MESGSSLFNSCWWLQLWASIFNVSLDWFLNIFGVNGLISNIPKVQHLGDFREKSLHWRAQIFVWNKSFIIYRAIVDSYFDFLKSGIYFFWNAFSYFSFWILNPESWILNTESWAKYFHENGCRQEQKKLG